MRKIYSILLVSFLIVGSFSCSGLKKFSGYVLTEQDAAAAIRQLLNIGASSDGMVNAFSKENILSAIFPEPVAKVRPGGKARTADITNLLVLANTSAGFDT